MNDLNWVFDNFTDEIRKGKKLYDLKYILDDYNDIDWIELCSFNDDKYTRISVLSNDDIEVVLICWNNNQESDIHDHPENGCLLKVLNGSIKEELYDNNNGILNFKSEDIRGCGNISYIEGTATLHNVINILDDKTVTLHVYSPPNYTPKFYK